MLLGGYLCFATNRLGLKMGGRKSVEIFPGQRNKEKRALWGRYLFRAIERHYKAKFFSLFDNRCFKCSAKEVPVQVDKHPVLCVDHHVPMALGGHLVPGNLGVLCRKCNEMKLDKHPADFYTQDELQRLAVLLQMQEAFFDFSFDRDAWEGDREAYLLQLGIDAALVRDLLYDEMHPDFVGLPDPNRFMFRISIGD